MAESGSGRGFQLIGEPKGGEPARKAPMDFSAFVLSLSTSAFFHLGIAPEGLNMPELAQPTVDLPMGRQTIEILEMLRAKTRGNLSAEEARLLDRAIHDLQLRYVEVKRQQTG